MKLPQIILVVAAIGLGAFLYFTPFAPLAEHVAVTESDAAVVSYDIRDDINEIKNELDSATLARINELEEELNQEDIAQKISTYDSLIAVYDQLRKPIGSAHFALAKAKLSNETEQWTVAAERFLMSAKYMGEKTQKENWFGQAKMCYEKAVELSPDDLERQVDLGICLMESASVLGTAPMEGIGVLKNVEQLDPTNIRAQINLGYFAIRSGQFDKAEERFNNVIEIDKNYADVHLYLANLHEKQKKFDLAIADLEKYISLNDDPKGNREVGNYIEELKKNI